MMLGRTPGHTDDEECLTSEVPVHMKNYTIQVTTNNQISPTQGGNNMLGDWDWAQSESPL